MPIPDTSSVLLRWSLGRQNTVSMSDMDNERYLDMLWLAKVSIVSFQKWFPDATFVLMYNGDKEKFGECLDTIHSFAPHFRKEVKFINQPAEIDKGEMYNPYHFFPIGVWWKWIPFKLEITKHEIAVDTDIVCVGRPDDWYAWLASEEPILVAPERYEIVKINTCGDFCDHPLLQGKKPFNCGVVGQRAGHNYADRFFDITKSVRLGETHNSLFITEQGAINLWVRSLEVEGVGHRCLNFQRNAWVRDFLYFMQNGIPIETIHAVTWHKRIAKGLQDVLEKRISDDPYPDCDFLADLLKHAKYFEINAKRVLDRQLGYDAVGMSREVLLPGK